MYNLVKFLKVAWMRQLVRDITNSGLNCLIRIMATILLSVYQIFRVNSIPQKKEIQYVYQVNCGLKYLIIGKCHAKSRARSKNKFRYLLVMSLPHSP